MSSRSESGGGGREDTAGEGRRRDSLDTGVSAGQRCVQLEQQRASGGTRACPARRCQRLEGCRCQAKARLSGHRGKTVSIVRQHD